VSFPDPAPSPSAGASGYDFPARPELPSALAGSGGGRKAQRQRRVILAVILALVAVVVGALLWVSASARSPRTRVRYVNDTSTRLVVTPCGAAPRCVVEAGASIVRTQPARGEAWRVEDALTRESAGCIKNTDEATVRLSDTRFGGTC